MALELWRPSLGIRPWRPIETMEDMERRFEELFGREMLFPSRLRRSPLEERAWAPAIEMIEKDDKFIIKAELPGIQKEDIDVSVTGNTLTVKGQRKSESEVKEDEYHVCERSYGSFMRSITMPSSAKTDKIEANYEDGILEITLQKAPEIQPKKIDIKVK